MMIGKLTIEGSQSYIKGPGAFAIDVVGESRYQDNLEAICGPKSGRSRNDFFRATLIPEEDSPHDKTAVRVEIHNKTVGYLRSEIAWEYRRRLAQAGYRKAIATCEANVRGGWKRSDSEGHFGVWLDLPIDKAEKTEGILRQRIRIARLALPLYLWILLGICVLLTLCILVGELAA